MRLHGDMHATQYQKAKQLVIALIEDLRNHNKNLLPTESELVGRFEIGRNTVRRAVGDLVEEGVLERIQGKGTFIVDKKRELTFANWTGVEFMPNHFIPEIEECCSQDIPGLHVRSIPFPYHIYFNKLLNLYISGNSPDIVEISPVWLHQYKHLDLFLPLDNILDQNILNRRFPKSVNLGRINDELYSLNWALCPLVLYYNKNVLEASGLSTDTPPRTLDELFSMCVEISRAGDNRFYGLSLPFAFYEFSFSCLYYFLLSFGGGFANAMGNIIVDCDENREAGSWLSNLYKEGGIKIEHNLNGARVLFASDRLAFMIDGPQARAYLRRFSSLGADFDNHYGIAGMPVGPTEKHESVLLTPSLAISRNTSYPEEACRLIEYLSTNETLSKKFFDETGMIPCNRDILHKPVYANDPFASVVVGQTEVASVSPFTHPLFHRSYPFIIQFFYRMILEELDPGSQLKELRDIIDILGQADYLSMP